jgi:hypothetical protein
VCMFSQNIIDNPGTSKAPQITATGKDVYVVWFDNTTPAIGTIMPTRSEMIVTIKNWRTKTKKKEKELLYIGYGFRYFIC